MLIYTLDISSQRHTLDLCSTELTDGLCQSDDHFLACGELRDPAHNPLHSVHPHFQLHGPHPEALIPPCHEGMLRFLVHLEGKQEKRTQRLSYYMSLTA